VLEEREALGDLGRSRRGVGGLDVVQEQANDAAH
jgi:hypothetical protein